MANDLIPSAPSTRLRLVRAVFELDVTAERGELRREIAAKFKAALRLEGYIPLTKPVITVTGDMAGCSVRAIKSKPGATCAICDFDTQEI